MRIIAGEFRGRTLKAPKGEGTRPTTDRVRESMMSMVESLVGFQDAVVLDAFAGSGALGLESLSRGAQNVMFYEQSPGAVRILQENIKTLGLDSCCAQLRRADVLKNPPSHVRLSFDLIFLDPPYAYSPDEVLGLVTALRNAKVVNKDALVVYEHANSGNKEVDSVLDAGGFELLRRKKYGDTIVDALGLLESIGADA